MAAPDQILDGWGRDGVFERDEHPLLEARLVVYRDLRIIDG
eukprot:SAG25_NODE_2744_length_1408_cov_1.812834_2_plen_40_part_01